MIYRETHGDSNLAKSLECSRRDLVGGAHVSVLLMKHRDPRSIRWGQPSNL